MTPWTRDPRRRPPVVVTRAAWVGAVTVLVVAVAAVVTAVRPATYRATATVRVALTSADGTPEAIDMSTEQAVASSRAVAQIAAHTLGLSVATLRAGLSVTAPSSAQVLDVTYGARTAAVAAARANALADAYVIYRDAQAAADSSERPSATLLSAATPPASPATPRWLVTLAAALLAGVALGVAVAFVRDRLDPLVHDPDDARAATGVPCVGVVPLGSPADDPATDEAVRRIRDQLAANLDARPTTVALVAAVAGRSGADVADALAMAVARSGRRTVALGTRPGDDLAATLRGERRLVDAVEATPIAQLDVVAGDLSAPDTRDLAAGPSMRRAVDDLRTAAEVVVLYAGDTVGGSTALAVAPVADVALVVAEQGATRADDLSRMVVDLQGCDLEVAGVVLVDRTAPASAGASRLSARGPTYSRS